MRISMAKRRASARKAARTRAKNKAKRARTTNRVHRASTPTVPKFNPRP